MSSIVPWFVPEIPNYYDLINGKEKEDPDKAVERIIDKINKANGGDDL